MTAAFRTTRRCGVRGGLGQQHSKSSWRLQVGAHADAHRAAQRQVDAHERPMFVELFVELEEVAPMSLRNDMPSMWVSSSSTDAPLRETRDVTSNSPAEVSFKNPTIFGT